MPSNRDHESQKCRGGKETKLEIRGWRGDNRPEPQPRQGFEKERLVNKVKLYKGRGGAGDTDMAEEGHREGTESRTPVPVIDKKRFPLRLIFQELRRVFALAVDHDVASVR